MTIESRLTDLGYEVAQSVWDGGGGEVGISWYATTPSGERLPDDYGSADDAWRACDAHNEGAR